MFVNRYNKIAAELVVDQREVLEVRPRTMPPQTGEPSSHDDDAKQYDEERWDNAPCTD
jgi:hypothetical protein